MIPEQVKSEIIKRRALGATWTSIAKWLQDEHGVDIHRTTIQRWHDKENPLEVVVEEDSLPADDLTTRVKLDKKVATYKSEADFYKKLYQASLKDNAKKEIIVDAIKDYTKAFPKVTPRQINPSSLSGSSPQIMVAPLSDTHIGEHVYKEQMNGLNEYTFEIFNKSVYKKKITLS